MTDEVDLASEREQIQRDAALTQASAAVAAMPKGVPGHCDGCGDYFARLVGGLCGFCRDKGRFA